VKELRPAENVVVVGRRPDIMKSEFVVHDLFWSRGTAPANGARISVRTRYRQKAVAATVIYETPEDSGETSRMNVALSEPVFAITPGQAAVFYDGDAVLGGGWIV